VGEGGLQFLPKPKSEQEKNTVRSSETYTKGGGRPHRRRGENKSWTRITPIVVAGKRRKEQAKGKAVVRDSTLDTNQE